MRFTRDLFEIVKALLKAMLGRGVYKSYSQFGEDLIIRPFLPEGRGFYVDVGCYHPILYSNTYRLYRMGWSGIAIDPNPKLRKLFNFFRSRDRFINIGVGEPGERSYFEFSDGAYNTFDRSLLEGYKKRTRLIQEHMIPVSPLRDILRGVSKIDVLNVDVEGLDLKVLESHDWRIEPRVIIVEATKDSEVSDYLRSKGYSLVGLTKLNCVFVKSL